MEYFVPYQLEVFKLSVCNQRTLLTNINTVDITFNPSKILQNKQMHRELSSSNGTMSSGRVHVIWRIASQTVSCRIGQIVLASRTCPRNWAVASRETLWSALLSPVHIRSPKIVSSRTLSTVRAGAKIRKFALGASRNKSITDASFRAPLDTPDTLTQVIFCVVGLTVFAVWGDSFVGVIT